MTRCPHCNYEFHNVMLRRDCPWCARSLKPETKTDDDGVDVTGFALGYATGIPISPSHGISGAALLGAAFHSSPAADTPAESKPFTSGGGDFGGGGASSSYDSGSSSGSSDSGSSGGGGE